MPPRPLVLRDAPKGFHADVEKLVPPEETVARLRRRLAALDLDILAETRRIDNGRLGIPVYFSICGRDARRVIGNRKQMGKGATPAQAEASAVMELAERYSLFSFKQEEANFTTATARSLGTEAIASQRLAQSVHDASDEGAIALEVLTDLPLRWTWAHDLTAGRTVRIPFDWFYAINAYNGPAAGNGAEEAICQGICEVVERHVSARIDRSRPALPAIDADSVADPVCRDLMEKFQRRGVVLHLSDFSLDTGIPSIGVLAWDPATFPGRSEIVWTAGTATSPARALSRTLTEVAQLAGDFDSGTNFEASGLPKFTDPSQAAFVTAPGPRRRLDDLPDLSHANIRVEVDRLVRTLADRGMPVLLVDITHPRLGVPAFYTIVPGACFRERAPQISAGLVTAKLIAETRPAAEALARLEDFNRLLPDRHFIHFYQGVCLLELERLDAALTHLHRAARLAPPREDLASIQVYIATALTRAQRWAEALEALEAAAALDERRSDVHNLMGFCHFKRGDHRRAIACFERVLAIDPGSAIDHANIGVNLQALGEIERAVEAYQTALSLDPGIPFAWKNLLQLQAGGGEW
jgi:ribosomal protein S12 methylthiotransferase accessory factor